MSQFNFLKQEFIFFDSIPVKINCVRVTRLKNKIENNQLVKARFIKVNELKLTQIELL